MSEQQLQATVYGRVQGVSFRFYTQREATRLGLVGWVANQRDGTVRVVAEGPEDAIGQLVVFLHHGPSAARVDDVDVEYTAATGQFKQFQIRH